MLLFSTKMGLLLELLCIVEGKNRERKFFSKCGQYICRSFHILTKVCFHYKWNGAKSLSPESDCRSCLTSSQKTYDSGSQENKEFQEIPWNAWKKKATQKGYFDGFIRKLQRVVKNSL